MSPITHAESFVCQGTIGSEAKFTKEVKISIEKANTYLISLAPLPSYKEGSTEFYSDMPVGIGTIEIVERLGDARLVIAKGKLLVTDIQENVVIGILLDKGHQYSIRLDKSDGKWSFLLHDSNHRESVSGFCK